MNLEIIGDPELISVPGREVPWPTFNAPALKTNTGTPYLQKSGVTLIAQTTTSLAGLEGFLGGFDEELGFEGYLEDEPLESDAEQISKVAGQLCYDDQTEILSQAGWVKFASLEKGTPVFTLNPASNTGEWQVPTAHHEYDSEGELFVAEGRDVSFAVTPEHRIWGEVRGLQYDFHSAASLESKRFKIRTGGSGWIGYFPSSVEVPPFRDAQHREHGGFMASSPEELEALAALCLYYATEGSLGSGGGGALVVYGDHEAGVRAACKVLKLTLSVHVDARNKCKSLHVGGGQALRCFMLKHCGHLSPNKRLPRWVLDLPRAKLVQLWDLLVATDGNLNEDGRESFYSTSEFLAGAAQEILLKLGFGSSKRYQRGKNYPVAKVVKKLRTEAEVGRRTVMLRRPYFGRVYCVTVPNGIVCVRRAGKVHYSGNCYFSFGENRTKNDQAQKYFDNIKQQRHGCYDIETEVLTSDGWKRWDVVTETDFFATRRNDGRLEYHRPIRLIRFPYMGRMYRVESRGVDLLVTPDHKMLACLTTTLEGRTKADTEYKLVPAHELGMRSHAYVKTAAWDSAPTSAEELDVARLLGFTIGDGYTREGSRQIQFSLAKERKIAWLRVVTARLGWRLEGSDSKYRVDIPEPYLAMFRGGIYTANREKCIPQRFLATLAHEAAEALFEGLMQADGHKGKTGDTFNTTSQVLVGQVQQLCLHIGLAANVCSELSSEDRPTSYGDKTLVRLTIVRRELKPEVNKRADCVGRTSWVGDWEGEVFCAEVPNNTLYVRRNGKPVWSGNSVLEHPNFSFLFYGVSRSFTHELVRHRAGFGFCLAGDTEVFSGSKHHGRFDGVKKRWTMKQLYEMSKDQKRKGRIKLIKVRCFDGTEFVPAKIKGVMCSGVKDIVKVTLADGKVIRCSADHRFLTPSGWRPVRDVSVGDALGTNGLPAISLDKDWLSQRYHQEGALLAEIAQEALTVKWVGVIAIESDGQEMTYDLEVDHPAHNFVANGFVTHNSQVSQRYVSGKTLRFVERPEFQRHEVLHERFCARVDSLAREYDEIASLLMESMSKLSSMPKTEARKAVNQAARAVLPNETEAPIVVTANVRAWRHFCEMRGSKHAEPEIRSVAAKTLRCLSYVAPALFSDYKAREMDDRSIEIGTDWAKV